MVKWKALGLVRALGAEDSAAWLCGRSAYLAALRTDPVCVAVALEKPHAFRAAASALVEPSGLAMRASSTPFQASECGACPSPVAGAPRGSRVAHMITPAMVHCQGGTKQSPGNCTWRSHRGNAVRRHRTYS